MISIKSIQLPGETIFQNVFSLSEENDLLEIKTDQPIIGIIGITDFVVNSTDNDSLEKYFRISVDNRLHWSEWQELTLQNLQNFQIKKNHFFEIEYRFLNIGSQEILLYGVELQFEYDKPPVPSLYENHYYNKFFAYYNNDCIKWSLNVLKKIYEKGIVPKFIERKDNKDWNDEDYITFWWVVIYVAALRLSYNNVYSQMPHYTFLLKKYLENKGLFFGSEENLDELYYFMDKFYDEMSKRGSLCVFDKDRELPKEYENVKVRGELIRLIDKKESDEFVSGLILSEDQGWILSRTSPNYHNTDIYKSFVKAWESEKSVISLDSYPLYNPIFMSLDSIVVKGQNLTAINIKNTSSNFSGIGNDLTKKILVDPNLSYLISFKVQSTNNFTLNFGCKAFDSLENSIDLLSQRFQLPFDRFYNGQINSNVQAKDHYFVGVIFGLGETGNWASHDGVGTNLRFSNKNISAILPEILVDSQANSVYVYDIKVSLLSKRKDIYLSSAPEMFLFLKNNNYLYTDSELQSIIEKYLLPYSINFNMIAL